jgi:hypothetical protein
MPQVIERLPGKHGILYSDHLPQLVEGQPISVKLQIPWRCYYRCNLQHQNWINSGHSLKVCGLDK